MIESRYPGLSITKQCKLLKISRSSLYYEAKGESELNLKLMRLIDEQFLKTPWYMEYGRCPGIFVVRDIG